MSESAGVARMHARRGSSVAAWERPHSTNSDTVDLATAGLPAHQRLRELTARLWSERPADAFDVPAAPPAGLPSLRAAVAAHLTDRGLRTTVEQVLVTAGAAHAFSVVARCVLRRRDYVFVENPTNPHVLDALRPLPVGVSAVRPVADGHDQLLRRLDRRAAPRMVHLVPTLGPRGDVLSHEFRSRLIWGVGGHDVVVVDDVTQESLTFDPAPPPLAGYADLPNLVTVGSLGALHWGGLQVGWLRATPALVDRFATSTVGTPVSVLDQVIAEALLGAEDVVRAERVSWLRGCLDRATTALSAALPGFTWHRPAGGQTLWLRPPVATGPAFAEAMARFGVELLPGAAFTPRAVSEFYSLVHARPAEVVAEGVRRIAAAWRHVTGER